MNPNPHRPLMLAHRDQVVRLVLASRRDPTDVVGLISLDSCGVRLGVAPRRSAVDSFGELPSPPHGACLVVVLVGDRPRPYFASIEFPMGRAGAA